MPNGITAYPQGTWGGLVQVHTTNETYAKFAFYDGDPNNGNDFAKHGANFGWGKQRSPAPDGSRIQNSGLIMVDAQPL
jgi:carbohydrate-selective porin OprB